MGVYHSQPTIATVGNPYFMEKYTSLAINPACAVPDDRLLQMVYSTLKTIEGIDELRFLTVKNSNSASGSRQELNFLYTPPTPPLMNTISNGDGDGDGDGDAISQHPKFPSSDSSINVVIELYHFHHTPSDHQFQVISCSRRRSWDDIVNFSCFFKLFLKLFSTTLVQFIPMNKVVESSPSCINYRDYVSKWENK